MIDQVRFSKLLQDEQYKLIQLLTHPHIWVDSQQYAWYLESIYKSGDYTKTVLVHEAWISDLRSHSTCRVSLLYFQALMKETPSVEEKVLSVGKKILESSLGNDFLTSSELQDSWFTNKSEAELSDISKLCFQMSQLVDEMRYLELSIYVSPSNFEAIQNLCVSQKFEKDKKIQILERIDIKDPIVFEYIAASMSDDIEQGVSEIIPETYLENLKLRQSFCRFSPNSILMKDLYLSSTVSVILLDQKNSNQLYTNALFFMKHYPGTPEAFFVAGVYYMSLNRLDVARKFFSKSTTSLQGWIGAGLAFADESGHAISAFRTATIRYPKCVLPWLYLGMEHIRTNELRLAQSFLVSALELCTTKSQDTIRGFILNELAIICIKSGQYDVGIENLKLSCDKSPVFTANMGYAFLKQRRFDDAVKVLDLAVQMDRTNGSALAGLAFCYHCRGSLSKGIDLYNESLTRLGSKKLDNLVTNMIQLAVNEFALTVKHTQVDEDMIYF